RRGGTSGRSGDARTPPPQPPSPKRRGGCRKVRGAGACRGCPLAPPLRFGEGVGGWGFWAPLPKLITITIIDYRSPLWREDGVLLPERSSIHLGGGFDERSEVGMAGPVGPAARRAARLEAGPRPGRQRRPGGNRRCRLRVDAAGGELEG